MDVNLTKFNSTKSNMLIVRSKIDMNLKVPDFVLNDTPLNTYNTVK